MSGRPMLAGWLAMVSLLAAACGSGGPSSDTVSLMVAGEPVELQAFRDVVAAYEGANPGRSVELIEVADRDEMIAKLATAFAGGAPPDLFVLNYRYFAQFADKGFLDPVAERMDSSEVLTSDAFYPSALEAMEWDGEQACLPMNAASLVVYWNEDLFAEAGVAPPEPGWTWPQMLTAATQLTTDRDGDGQAERYGMAVDPELLRIAPFVWSAGGELVDPVIDPQRLALDTRQGMQAMRVFMSMRVPQGVTPTDREAEAEDPESRFLNGRVAMIMESRKVVPSFRTITDFEWDVASLPVVSEPASVLHADGYCLTRDAANPDAAWDFMEFALGPEGQRIAGETGRTVPSMIEVAESDAFLDPSLPPASAQVFLDNILVARPVPVLPTWPQIEDVANGLIEEGYYTGAEPEEVASEVVFQTEPLFEGG